MSEERVLLYWLIRHHVGRRRRRITGRPSDCSSAALTRSIGPDRLREGHVARSALDARLLEGFEQDLVDLDARERFDELAPAFTHDDASDQPEVRSRRATN